MAIIASNTEIEVDGMGLYSGLDQVFTIKNKGTSTFVDVTYHSVLQIAPVRYWFDSDGNVILPMGDLTRSMVAGGVMGASIAVMDVVDEATSTTLSVSCDVRKGILPVVADRAFPPRRCLYSGMGQAVPFSGYPLTTETFDIYTSADGVTWSAPTSVTTDDYREAIVTLPATSTTKFTKICASGQTTPIWQCRQREDCVGETAYIEWTSDSGKSKSWCFEAISIEREVTSKRTTEGGGILRGTFFPTEKNFKLKARIRASDLAQDELWFFDDFVTGEIKGMTFSPYLAMSFVAVYGNSPWTAVVTEKKINRSLTGDGGDLEFSLDLMQVRTF